MRYPGAACARPAAAGRVLVLVPLRTCNPYSSATAQTVQILSRGGAEEGGEKANLGI